ncbi:MAG: hypothetical protein A2W25_00825 [candidate division Zixibacteria bacterium RBG_16_53_22]|nr:MAG: hypothetical protein A2W25_00825 [candidate division Zixibacteria bacterium RBG_16_53_22]
MEIVFKIIMMWVCSMFFFAHNAHAVETTTTIGGVFSSGGAISFYVRDTDGMRSVDMVAVDKHAINRIYLRLTPAELTKLRELLDTAQKEAAK